MYKMNSSGPNMDPWGTPQVTFMETELVLLYEIMFEPIECGASYTVAVSNSMVWYIVSKAFDKSRKIPIL